LKRDNEASGKIIIDFQITAEGKVDRASFGDETTLKDRKLEACVLASVQKFEFPAVGKSTTVKYPVVMTP
jgi:hypothetical protein